jgi:succinylglutamate desuccinylase
VRVDRLLGHRFSPSPPGPFLLACAGVHGDEPAGLRAVQGVLATLHGNGRACPFELLGVAGNLAALEARRRALDYDLNRAWTPAILAQLRAGHGFGREAAEQRALLEIFDDVEARAAGRLLVVDLHTTSAASPPFVLCRRDEAWLGARLGLPLVVGLERWIDGTVLHHFTARGHPCIVVEAGQHDDPRSVATLERSLRRLIALEPAPPPPLVLEVFCAHALAPDATFELRPGLDGFRRVSRGELLGFENGRPVFAPAAGALVMPLARAHGEHAFFLAR